MKIENGEEMVRNEPYSDAKYTVDFGIKHCPKKLYKEFVELRKIIGENSNWMTLKVLMENFKKGAMFDLLAEGMNSLDSRVAILESKMTAEEKEEVVKTLGGK